MKKIQPNSIPWFCARNNMGLWTYHRMQREGTGPAVIRVPGGRKVIITDEAEEDWRRANTVKPTEAA
ncbi:hypothetical protein OKW50_000089 [Paraburkholderia youngii]|uniref:hypothetical protein n=1 Tax=Paraburkholderia youngii TaxID=2782701 RepID=UPI003D23CF2F